MINFSKNKCGDVVNVFCCDSCLKNAGVISKRPADSGCVMCVGIMELVRIQNVRLEIG